MAEIDCARCAGAACTIEDIEATPQLCPRRSNSEVWLRMADRSVNNRSAQSDLGNPGYCEGVCA